MHRRHPRTLSLSSTNLYDDNGDFRSQRGFGGDLVNPDTATPAEPNRTTVATDPAAGSTGPFLAWKAAEQSAADARLDRAPEQSRVSAVPHSCFPKESQHDMRLFYPSIVCSCLAVASISHPQPADAGPPSYLILRAPVAGVLHPPTFGYDPGSAYGVRTQTYSYGWFGVPRRQHAVKHSGWRGDYTQWKFQ